MESPALPNKKFSASGEPLSEYSAGMPVGSSFLPVGSSSIAVATLPLSIAVALLEICDHC